MKKEQIFYATFFLFGMFSCVNKKPTSSVDSGTVAADSSMIRLDEYSIKKIHLGNQITNDPLSSQIVVIKGKEKYLMLDESYIYMFDWDSGIIEDSIPITSCGHLYGSSGFTFINEDSIYIYNYNRRELFLTDMTGRVKERKNIPMPTSTMCDYISSVEALNSSRVSKIGNNLILSGRLVGCSLSEKENKRPVIESIDLNSNEIKPLVYYPEKYHKNNWGCVFLNSIHTVSDQQESFLVSFPILPVVYRFSSDFKMCDTLIMRSRYDTGILPSKMNPEMMKEDQANETRYFISQPTYANILYDPYRDLYFRVAQHKLDNWDGKSAIIKPFSIIVTNSSGKILSESSIIKDSTMYLLYNMHVCKDGVTIATKNKDEDNMYFKCYKIHKEK